jgi:hypothetical protein
MDLEKRTFTVGRSNTRGGEGRVIPWTMRPFEILVEWLSCLENPNPNH